MQTVHAYCAFTVRHKLLSSKATISEHIIQKSCLKFSSNVKNSTTDHRVGLCFWRQSWIKISWSQLSVICWNKRDGNRFDITGCLFLCSIFVLKCLAITKHLLMKYGHTMQFSTSCNVLVMLSDACNKITILHTTMFCICLEDKGNNQQSKW